MILLILACAEPRHHGKDSPTPDSGAPVVETDSAAETDSPAETAVEPCELEVQPERSMELRDDCAGEPWAPTWTLRTVWERADLGGTRSAAVLANLTDDNGNGHLDAGDTPDVVVSSDVVTALDGTNGDTIWKVSSTIAGVTTLVVGDVDDDGWAEVFLQGEEGSELRRGLDGDLVWTGPIANADSVGGGAAGMADFEGDGVVEVYFGRQIVDGVSGTAVCWGDQGQGRPTVADGPISVAVDLDGDDTQELVAGNTVYDAECHVVWQAAIDDGFPAVADLDGDGEGEVLVVGEDVTSLVDDGVVVWQIPLGGGPPAIADVDGDGLPDAIVPTRTGVTVLSEGVERWSWSHSPGDEVDGASAYDLDGDGAFEVVVNTPEGLVILDGSTGTVLATAAGAGGCQEPTITDLDGDDHAEIVFVDEGGVHVVADENGFAGSAGVWNQHAFSITNVDARGGIPTVPTPNWPVYNSFRAGAPIVGQPKDQNLVGELQGVCNDACPEVEVAWAIGNDGAAAVEGPVVVQIWGATSTGDVLLAEEEVEGPIVAGVMLAGRVTTIAAPVPLYDVALEIVGQAGECDEEDDVARWGSVVCL